MIRSRFVRKEIDQHMERDITFGLAVLADIGRSIRALGSGMTLLRTDTASSLEDAGLGALGLVVAIIVVGQLSPFGSRR